MSSGRFLRGADIAALDELANLLDDVGVRKRSDVAGGRVIRNAGLGMSGTMWMDLERAILPIMVSITTCLCPGWL
jgi:hypothetical protein